MSRNSLWKLGKALEGIGLVVVLGGVLVSINLGLQEESLKSMGIEFQALGIGGGLFMSGYLLERWAGKS